MSVYEEEKTTEISIINFDILEQRDKFDYKLED